MRKTLAIFAVVALAVAFVGPVDTEATGNGAPSGAHYNLNIIGVPKDKTADMTGNNGHRIFVKLWGVTKILLQEGAEYQVLDANGTDGTAKFQLPNPDPDGDGVTVYSIYARALGKPGGTATMTTCVDDPDFGEICSTESKVFVRSKGKSTFENVTKELTTIELVPGSDPALACGTTTVSLFDPCLEGYFWEYDNHGLKLLQLRFYEIPTDLTP